MESVPPILPSRSWSFLNAAPTEQLPEVASLFVKMHSVHLKETPLTLVFSTVEGGGNRVHASYFRSSEGPCEQCGCRAGDRARQVG
jgi:hypothetical protein